MRLRHVLLRHVQAHGVRRGSDGRHAKLEPSGKSHDGTKNQEAHARDRRVVGATHVTSNEFLVMYIGLLAGFTLFP